MVTADLLTTYRDSNYLIDTDPPIALRVGELCLPVLNLLSAHGVRTGAFVTAHNPFSQATDAAANERAHATLASDIHRARLTAILGSGCGRDGNWPPEQSLFILGISRRDGISLARRYAQNAFVFVSADGIPELVVTHDDQQSQESIIQPTNIEMGPRQ